MSFWKVLGIAAFFLLLVPTASTAAASSPLGKEYVSDISESGIGVAIQPPEGWEIDEYTGNLFITDEGEASMSVRVFPAVDGVAWKEFNKDYASYKVGKVSEGREILGKGKTRTAGQNSLYILVEIDGVVSKYFFFPYGDYVYRFEISAEEGSWDEVLPTLEKSLATARMLAKKSAPAPVVPKKLGKEYVGDEDDYGFGFRIQPPEGWRVESDVDEVFISPKSSLEMSAISISREEDELGDWEFQQEVFGSFTDKEFTKVLANVVSDTLGSDVKVIKAQRNVKLNGGSKGWSAEFEMPLYGNSQLYGKMYTFKQGEYVYRVTVGVAGADSKSWKKHRNILEKSALTVRITK